MNHRYEQKQFVNVAVDQLEVGPNIRTDTGDLTTLVASIREVGILEPVLVCPTETGDGVEILCGQRRVAAARQADLRIVPCIVRPRPSPVERVFLQLVENAERKDMSPIEHGDTFLELRANGYTQTQIADALGRSHAWVQKRCMVAGLPDFYRRHVHDGTMTMNLALDIPRELTRDADFTKKISAALMGGEAAVRQAVHRELTARHVGRTGRQGVRAQGGDSLTQMVAFRLQYDAVALLRASAADRGVSIAEWIEEAIYAHAREARGAA